MSRDAVVGTGCIMRAVSLPVSAGSVRTRRRLMDIAQRVEEWGRPRLASLFTGYNVEVRVSSVPGAVTPRIREGNA